MQIRGILTAFLVALPGATANAQSSLVRDMIDLYESAVNKITSYDVILTHTITWNVLTETTGEMGTPEHRIVQNRLYLRGEAPPPRKAIYRFAFSRGQVRVDNLKSVDGAILNSYWSDGETEKAYDVERRVGVRRSQTLSPFPVGVDYRCIYSHFVGSVSIVSLLRDRHNVTCDIQGDFCHLTTDPVATGNILPTFGCHVVLDSKRGFLPVLIREYKKGKDGYVTSRTTETVEFKDVRGTLVPVKAMTTHFDVRERLKTGLRASLWVGYDRRHERTDAIPE